ncbi:MAG TPA: AraC family transcriptional regulator [Marinagarivorans sp.]
MGKPAFENVVLDEHESIRVLQFSCPAFQSNHTWHFHPQYELTLILKGQGKQFVGDNIEAFYPGNLTLIGPNIPHCWISDNEAVNNEMLVVQFDPLFLGESFYNIPEAQSIHALFKASDQAVQFKDYSAEVRQQLDSVCQSEGMTRIAQLLILCEKLSQCERRLLVSNSYQVDKSVKGVDRLTSAINYVKNHFHEEIRQPDIAKLVNMAPQSFSRFFRTQTGRTFVSFVNEVRIAEACHLLSSSDKDILDIALTCGYGNISHFNRKFLEKKHLTPSQYRENQRLKSGGI